LRPASLLSLFAVSLPVLACTYTPVLPEVGGPLPGPPASDARREVPPPADAGADRAADGGRALDVAAPADARPPGVPDAPPAADAPGQCVAGQTMACYGGPAGTDGVGACHAGERGCAPDGTWSACLGEQRPLDEVCNGLDDDCDGTTDDGCPLDGALLRTAQRRPPSPVMGSLTLSGAVTFTHACPEGQAIVGFTGNYGSGIDSLGVRCGGWRIREDRSSRPYRYELLASPGPELPPRGGTGGLVNGVAQRLTCPPGQAVVGLSAWLDPDAPAICPAAYCPFSGTLCASVYGLTVSCAAYDLLGSPGNFRVARRGTPSTPGPRIGEVGGVGEVENPYACPAQGMVQEMKGAFGIWPLDCVVTAINGIQLTCHDPGIPLREPL
jgi:hypothetical protein